jgi:ornithine cyclodeaminase/alanine dehydrogenase-like protein (mu-crystallin family)
MSHDAPAIEVLVISGADVNALLSMSQCIELVDRAMRTVSRGGAQLPLRIGAPIPGGSLIATMPGYLAEPASAGAKVIDVCPANAARGLSSHTGVVVLFDPVRNVPIAIVDAASITAFRTAAASAVATRALARSDASVLAIIGTGEQAATHVRAVAQIRKLREVRVWGRTPARAAAFADSARADLAIPVSIATTIEAAVRGADIVCTTTSAREPILEGAWIGPGTHVNLVGASSAQAREADAALVLKSRFFVDFRGSALAQAGELLNALGTKAAEHIRAEIGEVLNGTAPGRRDDQEVTVYKSLGIAAQDLATAHFVYGEARRTGRGVRAPL